MKEDFLQNMDFISSIESQLRKKDDVPNTELPDLTGNLPSIPNTDNNNISTPKFEEIIISGDVEKITLSPEFEKLLKQFEELQGQQHVIPPQYLTHAEVLDKAQQGAALSGKFDPDKLVDLFTQDVELKQTVLTLLGKDCIIETIDRVQWLLKQEKRKEELSELLKDPNADVISMIAALPPTDAYGEMLRRVFREKDKLDITSLNNDQLLILVNVLESIEGINYPLPSLSAVRQRLVPQHLLDNYSLLSIDFTGREKELTRLFNFLAVSSRFSSPEGMLLTGVGGVGKTTLLAKFMEEVLNKKLANVAVLDFDRPGINPGDEFWLEMEISRQIELQYPKLGPRLKESRRIAREYKQHEGYEGNFTSQKMESARHGKSMLEEVGQCLYEEGLNLKPFLLVLDTMEEVTQRSLTGSLLDWIAYLPYSLRQMSIKIVISGRLYHEQLQELTSLAAPGNLIELTDFDAAIATKFLEKNQVDPVTIQKIIDSGVVPLRPLELKLVTKLVKDCPTAIDELSKDIEEGKEGENVSELFAGIIYRRVLSRITPKILNDIAAPGLVLRYLTAELIEEVLKPALGLVIPPDETPETLLNKLADYSWLAYRKDNKVWHTKELRRSTLRLMISKEADKVAKIRAKAIEFFTRKGNSEDIGEVYYHKLMMITRPEEDVNLYLLELRRVRHYFAEHIEDFPKPARAILNLTETGIVDDAELHLLPDKYFKEAYENSTKRLVRDRQYTKAFELYQRAANMHFRPLVTGENISDKWDKELLFSYGEWDEIKKLPNYQKVNSDEPSIVDVADYVFPAALIDINDIKFKVLEEMLDEAASSKKRLAGILSGPEGANILTRIAYGLTFLYANRIPVVRNTKAIERIIDAVDPEKNTLNTSKSLMLLNYITKQKPLQQYLLNPSTVRLDNKWLDLAYKYVYNETIGKYLNTFNTLTELFGKKPIDSKALLNRLDQTKLMKGAGIRLNLDNMDADQRYQLLKGPDPIFRDPCKYAIMEIFTTPEGYEDLAVLIQSVLEVQLNDLDPKQFAQSISINREQGLHNFIEIIDRSWALGDFLRAVKKEYPHFAKLNRVAAGYEEWEKAMRQLMISVK